MGEMRAKITGAVAVLLICGSACSKTRHGPLGAPSDFDAGIDTTSAAAAADGGSGRVGDGGAVHKAGANPLAPQFVPMFPGSGTSSTANAALPAGMVCDAVAGNKTHIPAHRPVTKCLVAVTSGAPAATLEKVLECAAEHDTVHVRLTLDPAFVDNTYGKNSIGWPHRRGHTFDRDLTKSDHAEILMTDATGKVAVQFKLDYISPDPSQPSGWGSLGVKGGDGGMITGQAAWILQWNTSLSRNLNERGYASYTVDSPSTDENYTPDPAAPGWDYRVVYEAWVDAAAFGSAGFGDANIEFVHASPSKAGEDTEYVKPGDCPPGWCEPDAPECWPPPPPPQDAGQCEPDDPRCPSTAKPDSGTACPPDDPKCTATGGMGGSPTDCPPDDPACTGTGGIAGGPSKPIDCELHPSDPGCVLL
jgi:hypothetical protein